MKNKKKSIISSEFNTRGDFNVIFIEWGPLASWENYFQAAQNSLNVGDYTGEFLAKLMQSSGLRHEARNFIASSSNATFRHYRLYRTSTYMASVWEAREWDTWEGNWQASRARRRTD